jgi:hypothetical protein
LPRRPASLADSSVKNPTFAPMSYTTSPSRTKRTNTFWVSRSNVPSQQPCVSEPAIHFQPFNGPLRIGTVALRGTSRNGMRRIRERSLTAGVYLTQREQRRPLRITEGVEQPILVKGIASRMTRDKSKRGRPAITSTPFTYERIERTVFFTALTNNGDRENFFGAIVTSGGVTWRAVAALRFCRPLRGLEMGGSRNPG